MKAERVAEQQVPQILGLTPDAPRPGGMLECYNAYVVDQGNALQTKQTGRYIDDLANVIDDAAIEQYGLQMFQYAASGGQSVIIDNLPFVYLAPMTTTVSGELAIGAWESIGCISVGGQFSKMPSYAVFEDKCVRVDGLYDNVYFDSGDAVISFSKIGLTPPSSAPSVSSTTGGSITPGDYEVYYSYVKNTGSADEVLSNPSPVGTVTVSGTAINAAVTASTDPAVENIRLFRTLYNAGGIWYKAIADVVNVTGTYKLILDDDSIRGNETLSSDWVKPPVADFCLSAANRLWLFDKSAGRAYFSDVGQLEKFSAFNYTSDFDRLDGDEITGVAALKNQIIVFKRNKTYAIDLYGSFAVTVIDSDEGCLNYRTIATERDAGFVIYLSNGGVKMLSMQGKLDLTLNKLWRTDMIGNVQALSDPAYCFGSYSPASGCYHLYFSVAGDPENSVHYVCSLRDSGQQTGAWSKYDHVYTLDPNDTGLKYYCFSILTDNAGLPFLCGAVNNTDSTDPVRLYQAESDSVVDPYEESVFITTAPVISKWIHGDDYNNGWPGSMRVFAFIHDQLLFFVTSSKVKYLSGFGSYIDFASLTVPTASEDAYVSNLNHNDDYVYVEVKYINTSTWTVSRTIKHKISLTTAAVTTYSALPSDAVVGMVLDYRCDTRMADYYGFTYSDEDDGAHINIVVNGNTYDVLLPISVFDDGSGPEMWDTNLISDLGGPLVVAGTCFAQHPIATNWTVRTMEYYS